MSKTTWDGETLLQLKNVPTARDESGRKMWRLKHSYLKVWRWARYGVRGEKLESFREGGLRWTSIEAIERFKRKTEAK